MSGNNLDANDEFDEQLRMQELYGDTKDDDTEKDPGAETGSIGQQPTDTPYECDLDKKAWFPKVRVARAPLHSGPTWPASRGAPFTFSLLRSWVRAPLTSDVSFCCICGRTDV